MVIQRSKVKFLLIGNLCLRLCGGKQVLVSLLCLPKDNVAIKIIIPLGVNLKVTLVSLLYPSNNDMALKLSFDQNPIMSNHKSNGNFKSHINLGGTQK
jgi:hypothetical protein